MGTFRSTKPHGFKRGVPVFYTAEAGWQIAAGSIVEAVVSKIIDQYSFEYQDSGEFTFSEPTGEGIVGQYETTAIAKTPYLQWLTPYKARIIKSTAAGVPDASNGGSSSAGSTTSVSWGDITGKPSAYPPDSHTHVSSDITNFDTAVLNVMRSNLDLTTRIWFGA